jgi:signal transduction histidine kinase
MRRRAPVLLVALGVLLLLGWYVTYTRDVARALRAEARRSGQMYARVYRALSDTSEDAGVAALLDLSRHIREMGVPVVVTDARGRVSAAANLPFEAPLDDPRVAAYVTGLDRENEPVVEAGVGTVHYGNPPLVRSLRVIPLVQAAMLALVLISGWLLIVMRGRASRERIWAGMARESAHQLGTPLSSLSGWIELLKERTGEHPAMGGVVAHMEADLERLDRVSSRFERIGRPPRHETVNVGELVERVAGYFRARVPTLAHTVSIISASDGGDLTVEGDPVLLEWAVEVLVKNAVDALAGRGGTVKVTATALPEHGARLRVSDDGPGIPREQRARVFEPGFSTKAGGWGIGLPLARRIIEEAHGGSLLLVPGDRGATFDIILR